MSWIFFIEHNVLHMVTVQKLQVTASNFPISITLRWDLFLSPLAPVEVPWFPLFLTEVVT